MNYTDGLQSPRLTTRFVTQDDVAVWIEFCSNDECLRFTTPPGNTAEERSKFCMDLTMKRYAEGRYGLQALISKETGAFIGKCGIMLQEMDDLGPVIEIGYHLLPRYWGQGYAAEAAQMFRDYAFANNISPFLVSIIDGLNDHSKKVAIRNGMTLADANARFRGDEYHLYRITRNEWEALKKNEAPAANK